MLLLNSRVAGVALAFTLAACGSADGSGTDASGTGNDPGLTPPLVASTQLPIVTAALGTIDLNRPIATIRRDLEIRDRVSGTKLLDAFMKSLAVSIGTDCDGCHVKNGTRYDYEAATPNLHIAAKMWDRWLLTMKQTGGEAFYCDSCHQGKAKFLVRATAADQVKLDVWMKQQYVDRLQTKSGTALACATCHGTPNNYTFLTTWK